MEGMLYDNFLLTLTSADSSTGVSTQGPLTFQISTPMASASEILAFRVKNLSCQFAAYNVTSAATDGGRQYNLDSFNIVGSVSGSVALTIPPGLYTDVSLSAALAATILAATGSIVTVTISSITKAITITRTGGVVQNFTTTASYQWTRLGFPTVQGPVATLVAPNAYRLNMTDSWRLTCPTLASIRNSESVPTSVAGTGTVTKSSVIFTLPIAITLPWNQCYNQIPSEWYWIGGRAPFSVLEFNLIDDNDFPVVLAAQTYWSADIEFRCRRA